MKMQFGVSASKPRALLLCPEAPFPITGGGPLRTASLFTYLAERCLLDLILFQEPGVPDPRDAVPSGTVNRICVVRLPQHGMSASARVVRNGLRLLRGSPPLLDRFSGFHSSIAEFVRGQSYEIALIEHFWAAPYITVLRANANRIYLDLHNIESEWHRTLGNSDSGLRATAHKRFAANYRALERKWLPRFDGLLVTGPQDATLVSSMCPVETYSNALPFRPLPIREETHSIVFTGNLEYEPNIAAVRYFSSSIWPLLRERDPLLVWRIAGKNSHAVQKWIDPDSRVLTEAIDDPLATLSTAKVAVVPLLAGSGTRLKVLEAWAAGTPVVSTTFGAQGLGAQPGEHLLIADSPELFADSVHMLLSSDEDRRRLSENARSFFEAHFTWEAAWRQLDLGLNG